MRRNHLAALDDAALVAHTRDGDVEAFGALWERHRDAAARAAYERLPERWRQALWYREVEDLSVAECARILGATPNSTTVILKRAREGFAQEWIRENLERRGASDECAWVTRRLPRHARGKATPGDARRITAHLASCADCTLGEAEARHLDGRLAVLLLPALLGTDALRRALTTQPAPTPASGAVARLLPRTAAGRWALTGAAAAVVGALVVTAVVWPRPASGPVPAPVEWAAPTPTPAPTPTVETTPDAEPAPGANPAPAPPAAGDAASPAPPAVAERPLTVDALPATTPLYPVLTGLATSGATVEATFTGSGGSVTAVTTAGADGRWSLTQNSVSGAVSFTVRQRYTNSVGVEVTESTSGSVSIVAGVTVEVMSTGDSTSTILLAGPAGATVELRSGPIPTLDGTHVLGPDGTLGIPTSIPKEAHAPLRVRLLSGTAAGPWVTW